MLERLWRGATEDRDRVRDDTLDRRAAEIMERCGCDWFEALFRAYAETTGSEAPDVENSAARSRHRQAGRTTLSGQIGHAWQRDRGTVAPGRKVRATGSPAAVMRGAERTEVDAGAPVTSDRDARMPLDQELRLLLEAAAGASADSVRVYIGPRVADLAIAPPATATARRTQPAANAECARTPVERLAEGGGGSPLPAHVRTIFEQRFGHSFEDVRVHDSSLAGEAARSIGAVAYTVGNHIVFAPGEWRPETPEGLQLLAHELAHVIQQDGASNELSPDLEPAPTDDALEHEADRAADSAAQGERVSLSRGNLAGVRRRLQRAVSKVCNPPSEWLAMAAMSNPALIPSAVAAAAAFGALAEAFISTDVIARTGVAPGNFYLDNPLAGPIDPAYVAFILGKNPGLSLINQVAIAASMVVRPDVLMDQPPLTEFEEVKPDSASGRTAGRAKVRGLNAFYATFGLPYTPGATYTPHPAFVIVSATITGIPFTATFETRREANGLLVYSICIETDWLKLAERALLAAALIIVALLASGALKPVPLPPLPALASVDTAGTCSGNCSGACPNGTCNT